MSAYCYLVVRADVKGCTHSRLYVNDFVQTSGLFEGVWFQHDARAWGHIQVQFEPMPISLMYITNAPCIIGMVLPIV